MSLALSTGLDFIILGIFILSIIIGVRRGLLQSILSLFGKLAALVLAIIFSASLGSYIDAHFLNDPMRDWLVDKLTLREVDSSTQIDFDDLFENRPEFFSDVCSYLGVDVGSLNTRYNELKTDGVEQAKSVILTVMVDPISSMISRVIAFVVIFLAVCLLIWLLSIFSKLLKNLPIIRKFDKLGGGVIGVLTALLISFVVISVISSGAKYFFRNFTSDELNQIQQNTIIYKHLYNIDPLKNLFTKA